MAIAVKDIHGTEHNVATRGVAIAGLTTGIIGSALGLMNSGMLGNLGLGGVGGNMAGIAPTAANLIAEGANCCFVNKDMFYNTLINQINTQAERDIAMERRFASVESAIATNAAVGDCNKAAIVREFDVVDNRFTTEQQINNLILQLATCQLIKGTTVVTPSQIGSTYVNPVNVLEQHEARAYGPARPFCGPNPGCACGY